MVKIVIPSDLSDEQRRLAAELDGTLTERNRDGHEDSGFFSKVKRAFS
ncbi:MAG: hypothetical protein IT199_02135 [Solirubrobacterales bacterium]|nr:hypothetical protein [Solirubrobacterales bacterium]